MVIIGLAGGSVGGRDEVAATLHAYDRARWAVWSSLALNPLRVTGKQKPLPPDAARARVLEQGLKSLYEGPRKKGGLIYSHVQTEAEAEVIRAHGGVIWHVYGLPCNWVAIRPGDTLVTPELGGHRHYLDPLEALSDLLLRQAA